MDETDNDVRGRAQLLEDADLGPDSLVKSWFFHVDDVPEQGLVVGEPQPGMYLCEFRDWFDAKPPLQRVVPLTTMIEEGWHFYDSHKALVAYELRRSGERETA